MTDTDARIALSAHIAASHPALLEEIAADNGCGLVALLSAVAAPLPWATWREVLSYSDSTSLACLANEGCPPAVLAHLSALPGLASRVQQHPGSVLLAVEDPDSFAALTTPEQSSRASDALDDIKKMFE